MSSSRLLRGTFILVTSLLGCGSTPPARSTPTITAAPQKAAEITNACLTSGLRELGKLREPMRVTIYFSPSHPAASKTAQRARDFIENLAKESNQRIKIDVLRVLDDETYAQAKDAGITAVDDADERQFMVGISFKYRAETDAIPFLPVDDGARGFRYLIVSRMRELRDRADERRMRIGVLAGTHEIALDEPNLVARIQGSSSGPSIKKIVDEALPYYQLVPIDLRGGNAPIDESLVGLVVTQPGRDLTDDELRRIDEFLLRGGKTAAFFTSAVNLNAGDASMTATLDRHRLDRLFAGYGIEMQNDVVLDRDNSFYIPAEQPEAPGTKIVFHGLLLMQNPTLPGPREWLIDDQSIPLFHIAEVAWPYASTLIPHPEKQPNATLRVIAQSAMTARASTANVVPLSFKSQRSPADSPASTHALAISVTGKLHSAMGQSIPDANGRLLVISSAQMVTNPFARAGNPPISPPGNSMNGDEELLLVSKPYAQKWLTSTIVTFKQTLDWMTIDDELRACEEREGE